MVAGITLVNAHEALRYLTIRVNRSAKVRFTLLFWLLRVDFVASVIMIIDDFARRFVALREPRRAVRCANSLIRIPMYEKV